MQTNPKPTVRRVLRAILLTLLLVVFAVVFYISVILANPQEEENPIRTDPPLASAAPPAEMRSAADLPALLQSFPGPVLMASDSLTLIGGGTEDVAVPGGWARVLTLLYESPDGHELAVRSFWPARSEEALDTAGWRLSAIAGQSVAGMESVRLEKGDRLRLQCQGADALYTVETDRVSGEELAALLQPLQLAEP